MSFRVRLVLALLFAAVVPLVVFALGVRRNVAMQFGAGERMADSAAVAGLRQRLTRKHEEHERMLESVARVLVTAPQTASALAGADSAKAWLIDFAGRAIPGSGLDALQLQDSDGTVLSTAPFRNLYGQRVALPHPADSAAWLIRLRGAGGPVTVLGAVRRFHAGGRELTLTGGRLLDSASVGRLGAEAGMTIAVLPAGATGGNPAPILRSPLLELDAALPRTDSVTFAVTRAADPFAAFRAGISRGLATALALAGVVAGILAVMLGSGVSRPLRKLAEKAEAVDPTHLEESFASGRADEVGRLSNSLDAMLARLRRRTAELGAAEQNAAAGELARQVNHDVKNGLAPIRNVLRHLSETADTGDGTAFRAVFLERRATLEASVQHLEDLARTYARKAPAAVAGQLDAGSLLHDLARELADPRVTVIEPGANLPLLITDPVALRRILQNLATNAIESLPPGSGSVSLSAHGREPGMVTFVVTDTGRGMNKGELDRAFRDFHTTKPGGTGLGLSSVRRLVLELGGTLRASSSPGAGSTFEVALPAPGTGGAA